MSTPAAPAVAPTAAPWVRWAVLGVVVLTTAQLAVGASSDLQQFAGKGFAARLGAYPVLMLLVPLVAVVRRARRHRAHEPSGPLPWAAALLVALPFLVDVTGNTLDLYDAVPWWDDANHLVNWVLLSGGAGLLLRDGGVHPRWALGVCTTGVGALLAVAWELGEWLSFLRSGEVDGGLAAAYGDTLGDLALGCLGAALAGVVVARRAAVRAAAVRGTLPGVSDQHDDALARPTGIGHVRLTVTDVHRSKVFYTRLLGTGTRTDFSDRSGDPAVRTDPDRVFGGCSFLVGRQVLGLRPVAPAGDVFDPDRVGLDHLALVLGSREELVEAAARLEAAGVEHGEVTDLPAFGVTILSVQDPDGINLELSAALEVALEVQGG